MRSLDKKVHWTSDKSCTWQTNYDHMEPRTEQEDRKRRILALRWELNIDPEAHYTLEELEEMYHEQD